MLSAAALLGAPRAKAIAGGKFLGVIPFQNEGDAPVGQATQTELDERRYSDLSRITVLRPVTPPGDFFLRSGASQILPNADQWKVAVEGLVERPLHLEIRSLRAEAEPMGLHLIECAGNVRIVHFGLISVANWSGVPIAKLLARAGVKPGAAQVYVAGFDQYANPSHTSVPGAEWVFPLDALKASGAFLATGMNGEPLTRDHGAPVRLVVPGWYGCSCIKWVQTIRVADDTVEATSQMREYAVRTLQSGVPELARDFDPATIDPAAIPVRVEKWSVAGKLQYRITGLLWGGSEPLKTLQIRFNPDDSFVTVEKLYQTPRAPWTVWEHTWTPAQPGIYAIQMAVSDPVVRARKMDAGYYVRFVEIDEA